jgi:hypothetical protein
LVHGGTTFVELGVGVQNLRCHLQEQSTRRVNLVRNHFGLFSQCAEGLEWLKEYRKGNLRVEELPGKERNYRKEREAMRRVSVSNSPKPQIVKGMEQLKRAFGTLELAKVEAKNSLAPILERMKKMREVRSAEKVLKGMSTLLDYPRSMKTAFERGELKDVIQLYQRVQSIPDTSGLKITTKIKRAAESVVFELKKTSLLQALSPSTNVNNILRHAQILLELEGGTSYLKILRLSFLRQASEFLKSLRDIREKMMLDAIEAYDQGQEVNLALKSSSLMSNNPISNTGKNMSRGEDIHQQVYQIARKFVYFPLPESLGNAGSTNSVLLRPRASRVISQVSASIVTGNRPRNASNSSTNSGNGGLNNVPGTSSKKQRSGSFVTIDEDDGATTFSPRHHSQDETGTVVQGGGANGNAAGVVNEWTESAHAILRLDELLAEYEDIDEDYDYSDDGKHTVSQGVRFGAESGTSQRTGKRDFSILFCNLVRRAYTERIVELVARWFPCLFRLCCEILTFNNTDKGGGFGSGGLKAAFNTTFTKTMKSTLGLTSVSKLLGMILFTTADNLQQSIHGLRPSFVQSFLSPEVVSAMNELDTDLTALQASFAIDLQPSPHVRVSTASQCTLEMTTNVMTHCVRFIDISHTVPFIGPIRQQHEALVDAFYIHEALDSAFANAFQKISSTSNRLQQEQQSSPMYFGQPFHSLNYGGASAPKTPAKIDNYRPFPSNMPVFTNKHATQLSNVLFEMDVASPSSPFFEAFRVFTSMAKESESSVAQKVLDRILEKATDASETLLFELDVEKLFNFRLFSSPYGCVLVPEAVGVETAVHEYEAMVSRGIAALAQTVKRPDWTAIQVYDSLLQQNVASFIEKLRRKVMMVEELRIDSTMNMTMFRAPATSNTRRGMSHRRASMTQDNLVLSSLEEDLKLLDIGWERDFSSFRVTKNAAWIDFLRGILRMRCVTFPRLVRKVASTFSIEDALSANSATTTVPTGANLPPTTPAATLGSNTKTPGTTGDSILNRLFATETAPETPFAANDMSDTASTTMTNSSAAGGLFRTLRREPSQIINTNGTNVTTNANGKSQSTASALAYTNSNTISNSNSPSSLSERIMHDWTTTTYGLMNVEPTTYTQLMNYVRPYLTELITLETNVVEMYVNHRMNGLKSIVFSSYATAVQEELLTAGHPNNGQNTATGTSLPGHLTRLLLALHEEKHALQQFLGQISLDMKSNRRLFYLAKRSIQQNFLATQQSSSSTGHQPSSNNNDSSGGNMNGNISGHAASSNAVTADTGGFSDSDTEENDSEDEFGSVGKPQQPSRELNQKDNGAQKLYLGKRDPKLVSTASSNSSQRYAHYMYQQLGHRVLDVYEELIKRLYAGSFGYLADASSVGSSSARNEPENPFKTSQRTYKNTSNPQIVIPVNNITTNPYSAAGSNNASKVPISALPLKAVLQATEELEFLKVVLRPLLLDTQILQKKGPLSSTEIQALQAQWLRTGAGGSDGVPKSELLLQWGQMLVVLIQQHQ